MRTSAYDFLRMEKSRPISAWVLRRNSFHICHIWVSWAWSVPMSLFNASTSDVSRGFGESVMNNLCVCVCKTVVKECLQIKYQRIYEANYYRDWPDTWIPYHTHSYTLLMCWCPFAANVFWIPLCDRCGVCLIILPAVKKSDLAIQFGCPPEGHNDWIEGGV